ncbi:hypothetical protein [Polyangium mundeleinium]|uniref:Uncharacterized protein n=1 Tax=Polyangium mundeleinium TaxID=2995306 RepID=A0ABT5EKZ9_9BACT|nr:hypothetical protein [Polyangium mundeleinium]MDC0741401.1 hypothetical protein [Polyangium mundeleinium]
MATMQEGALLFSLKYLARLEEARVRPENEAAGRLEHEEAQRHAREASSMHARIEAERRARMDAERRAEEARIEAIRFAAVERARAEAEANARLEVMRIVEAHERALAALKEDKQNQRLGRAVRLGALGSMFLFAAAFGFYFGKVKPDGEAQLRAQQAAIDAADEEASRLRKKLAERDARIKEAERVLGALARPAR